MTLLDAVCRWPDCTRTPNGARHLCKHHYDHARYIGTLTDWPGAGPGGRISDIPTPLTCDCPHPHIEPIGGLFGPAPACTLCQRPRAADLEAWLTRPGGPHAA